MRDHEVLIRELVHPLTRPDTLWLALSFASRSTLSCIGGRINMDLALSVHFSRTSMEGIVGVAGTIPSISAGFSTAAFINHVVTLTHNVDALLKLH